MDDENDWQHANALRALCQEVCLLPLKPGVAKAKSLQGLIRDEPLTLPYYRDRELQAWVDKTIQSQSISQCVIFSSAMAQYVMGVKYNHVNRIADLVDVDSDKWRQYSDSHRFPMNWLYRREAEKLGRFEAEIATEFNGVFLVSEDELKVFRSLVPGEHGAGLDYYHNGVDYEFFDPDWGFENPYDPEEKVMVFTGAMDYWANVDAVKWFADDIFPIICESQLTAKFYIVGSNPTDEVVALGNHKNVRVTGRAEDVRPYIKHAHFCVAPLRIARGVQNKVLEAMAMGRRVVATPAALEGIEPCEQYQPTVAESVLQFAEACCELLAMTGEKSGAVEARHCIEQHYNWERNLRRFSRYLQTRSETLSSSRENVS